MSYKATIKIGTSCTINAEGETPVDLIKAVSQFAQLPKQCGHCGSANLSLTHRTAGQSDEYDYLQLKCMDCGARGDIGQSKSPKGGIFFRFQPKDRTGVKDGFYKYWEQKDGAGSVPSNVSAPSSDDEDDDIPF